MRMPRPARCLQLATAAAAILATSAPAAARQAEPTPWMRGFSLGLPFAGGITSLEAFTAAFHFTSLPRGSLGVDFSIATMPRAMADGILVGLARTGLVLPVRLDSGGYVLPGVGLGTMFGAGYGGAGGMLAAHAGAALVVGQPDRTGIRLGASMFLVQGQPLWLFEMGLVGLPSRRRNRDP